MDNTIPRFFPCMKCGEYSSITVDDNKSNQITHFLKTGDVEGVNLTEEEWNLIARGICKKCNSSQDIYSLTDEDIESSVIITTY